ncbi:MAG: hypothetical protein R6V53_05005 [Candidatus Woesearchaeota archaeon]
MKPWATKGFKTLIKKNMILKKKNKDKMRFLKGLKVRIGVLINLRDKIRRLQVKEGKTHGRLQSIRQKKKIILS